MDSSTGFGSTDEVDDERLADRSEAGESILIVSSCSVSSSSPSQRPLSVARSCSSSDCPPSGSGRCCARKVSLLLVDTPCRLQSCNKISRLLVRFHSSAKSQLRFLGVLPVGTSSFVPFSRRFRVVWLMVERWLVWLWWWLSMAVDKLEAYVKNELPIQIKKNYRCYLPRKELFR